MRIPYVAAMPHGGSRFYGGEPHFGQWDSEQNRFVLMFKGRTYRVAVLICEAFNGEKPFADAVVMHLDEDSRNNRPTNLEWGTQKENLNFPGFKQKRSELSTKCWSDRKVA
ncbi:HNH endonuclease signature motif containing protein [Bradyrhizobium sp. SZCCHNRI3052]|uniref:HNH endonuclease signature motif containing protein n=1 Tax=Bradyrhizobium sp. SZCCHNRI3052 TaxID=3057295 RepID=UPI0029166811|nr:HNH endonuclease signature motif containing protein [Bradyrhizobium sp. SZCCHNRI3052]